MSKLKINTIVESFIFGIALMVLPVLGAILIPYDIVKQEGGFRKLIACQASIVVLLTLVYLAITISGTIFVFSKIYLFLFWFAELIS